MKKLKLYQTIPLIIIVVLLCYLFKHYFVDLHYTLTFNDSDLTFNCTPEEFINNDNGNLNLPKEINALRKNATIDESGNLELNFSRYQFYKFRNSVWFTDIKEFKERPYLTHSDDFSHIVLNVTPEVKGYTRVQLKELAKDIDRIIAKIRFKEKLRKDQANHFDIVLEIIDVETDEIIKSFVLEADSVIYNLPKLEVLFTKAPFLGQ